MSARVVSLGVSVRQWLASAMICALLLQILVLPGAYAAVSYDPAIANFEPVNEDLSLPVDLWRKANAGIEASLTPWRFANWSASNISDDDKKKKILKTDEKPSVTDTKKALDTADVTTSEPEPLPAMKEGVPVSSFAKRTAAAPPVPFVNQLPDNERDSVYSYENNLGSPKGQVEMDSPNQAAALRIRHRAGIANFSFGLPLASLSGRGIDAGASMTYNSRTWNKSCTEYTGTECTTEHFTYDVEQSWIAPGFSSGFGYLESYATTRSIHIMNTSNFYYYTEIVPGGITDADGSRHQFACVA